MDTYAEIDMRAAVYPVAYVKEQVQERYKVSNDIWYRHLPRIPQATVEMAGWKWYTQAEFDAVLAYFAALPSIRRRITKN